MATTGIIPTTSQPETESSPEVSVAKPAAKEVVLPSKSAAALYGYGDCNTDTPYSLNKLMANRSSIKGIHSSFVRDLEKRRGLKSVGFSAVDYGYGEGAPDDDTAAPPTKRRRFQRRNSKTPAMLMRMRSPLLNLDFLSDLDKDSKDEEKKPKTKSEDGEDNWDGGLEIAEQLVSQLRNRRRNSNRSSC